MTPPVNSLAYIKKRKKTTFLVMRIEKRPLIIQTTTTTMF